MKTINYFWLALLIIVAIIGFSGGFKYKEKQAMKDFTKWNLELAEMESKVIKANTRTLEAENKAEHERYLRQEVTRIGNEEYIKLQRKLELSHQEPDGAEIEWDEYVDFVPDISEPEIVEIIKEVQIDIVDSTIYPYRDKINGYSMDLNVIYESLDRLFFFTPENLNLTPRKKPEPKDTTVGVWYLTGDCFLVSVQYDFLPFLVIGGSAGWSDEPIVGINLGYRF